MGFAGGLPILTAGGAHLGGIGYPADRLIRMSNARKRAWMRPRGCSNRKPGPPAEIAQGDGLPLEGSNYPVQQGISDRPLDVRHRFHPASRYTPEEFTHLTSGSLLHDNFNYPPDLKDAKASFAQAAPRLKFPRYDAYPHLQTGCAERHRRVQAP